MEKHLLSPRNDGKITEYQAWYLNENHSPLEEVSAEQERALRPVFQAWLKSQGRDPFEVWIKHSPPRIRVISPKISDGERTRRLAYHLSKIRPLP